MTWSYFIIFAIISVICWAVGAVASWKGKKTMAYALTGIGLAVFFTYYIMYVDKSGASATPHNGRDTAVV